MVEEAREEVALVASEGPPVEELTNTWMKHFLHELPKSSPQEEMELVLDKTTKGLNTLTPASLVA